MARRNGEVVPWCRTSWVENQKGPADWIGDVASSAVLDTAFTWLFQRRIDYADSADAWNVRRRWPELKLQLQHDLLHGGYRFLTAAANSD